MGEGRGVHRFLVGGNLREIDNWGDPDVDGRIILRESSGSRRRLWGIYGFGSG